MDRTESRDAIPSKNFLYDRIFFLRNFSCNEYIRELILNQFQPLVELYHNSQTLLKYCKFLIQVKDLEMYFKPNILKPNIPFENLPFSVCNPI